MLILTHLDQCTGIEKYNSMSLDGVLLLLKAHWTQLKGLHSKELQCVLVLLQCKLEHDRKLDVCLGLLKVLLVTNTMLESAYYL